MVLGLEVPFPWIMLGRGWNLSKIKGRKKRMDVGYTTNSVNYIRIAMTRNPLQGAWVWSLVRELRSHMLRVHGREKKKKRRRRNDQKNRPYVRKRLGLTDIFIILIVVMASWIFTYIKTSNIHFKHVQFLYVNYTSKKLFLKVCHGTSLVVQWLRLHLPVQGVWVQSPGQGAKIPHASRPKKPKHKTEAIL